MEYGNGIVGDMCIHMLDMVRWMLGLGWPKRVSSAGGILVQRDARSNISDTQSATFDFGDLQVVWPGRESGPPPVRKAVLSSGPGWSVVTDERFLWQGPGAARGAAEGEAGFRHLRRSR